MGAAEPVSASSLGLARRSVVYGGVNGNKFSPQQADSDQPGPVLVCLPAPSFVCDASEWEAAAHELARNRTVLTLGLPGFGSESHSAPDIPSGSWYVSWVAETLKQLQEREGKEIHVVAAGHAAGFILAAAGNGSLDSVSSITLVAPTCVGPVPTVCNRFFGTRTWIQRSLCGGFELMYRSPGLGHLMHRKFTGDAWVYSQLVRHVYVGGGEYVTPSLLATKVAFAKGKRPRRMAVSYVVGNLDPFGRGQKDKASTKNDAACNAMRSAEKQGLRIGVVVADSAPGSSKKTMTLLAAEARDSAVQTVPGSLLAHEEFPHETGMAVEAILAAFDKK